MEDPTRAARAVEEPPRAHGEDEAELELLVGVLPERLQRGLRALGTDDLLEIVLDLGRPPIARYPARGVELEPAGIGRADLDHVVAQVGSFGEDNRAGIERTLHRISALRNRRGAVVGLTLRVGRAVLGTIDLLRDLVASGKNLLLLGPPGVGKTTKLREIARVLAGELGKRVMVIDTSNEIGGDGDVPHPGIGAARRMQVREPRLQHAVMIEAVENHMPEAIVVDEIGTEMEAAAARTIAERGVQLVGTAHGNALENVVLNPVLADLLGGVQTVTLSDEEARRRGTSKTVRERRAPPTFDVVVELIGRDEVLVHADAALSVDRLLEGGEVPSERRSRSGGEVRVEAAREPGVPVPAPLPRGPLKIHAHGVSRDVLAKVIRELRLDARVTERASAADVIVALKSRAEDPRVRRALEKSGGQVAVLRRNTSAQMRRLLLGLFPGEGHLEDDDGDLRDAVEEVSAAIQRVLAEGQPVALAPRRSGLRRLQHRMVSRHHLEAHSVGSEPARHLVIQPR